MRSPHPLILCFVLLVAYSCQNSSKNNNSDSSANPLTFSVSNREKNVGNCDSGSCLSIKMAIPRAKGGVAGVSDSINNVIEANIVDAINSVAAEGQGASTIKDAQDSLLHSWYSFLDSMPAATGKWHFNTDGRPLVNNDSIVSIRQDFSVYLGGAHPNSFVNLESFDARTGRQLTLSDLCANIVGLKKLAEQKFRKRFDISDTANLDNQGFFFEGGKFALPENNCRLPNGLLLHYNPYEAASYSEGPVELVISQAELDSLNQ